VFEAADIIDKIVQIEWNMFNAVNEGGPRASCQDDRVTFDGMRRAQFFAWSLDVCVSYLEDLDSAVKQGRNLINEKYIHMMRNSSPNQYEKLIQMIPAPAAVQIQLAQEISKMMLAQTAKLRESFPFVAGSGRPFLSEEDISGITSIETYQLGELLTYSTETLTLLKHHIIALEQMGQSLSKNILENTVRFYGYETLGSAEAATKERLGKGSEELRRDENW
jgi:hypothetical protein